MTMLHPYKQRRFPFPFPPLGHDEEHQTPSLVCSSCKAGHKITIALALTIAEWRGALVHLNNLSCISRAISSWLLLLAIIDGCARPRSGARLGGCALFLAPGLRSMATNAETGAPPAGWGVRRTNFGNSNLFRISIFGFRIYFVFGYSLFVHCG